MCRMEDIAKHKGFNENNALIKVRKALMQKTCPEYIK